MEFFYTATLAASTLDQTGFRASAPPHFFTNIACASTVQTVQTVQISVVVYQANFYCSERAESYLTCDGVFHLLKTSEEEARGLHGMLHDFLSSADSFGLCQEEER